MSKKTRKKTLKNASKKSAAASPAKGPRASAKKTIRKAVATARTSAAKTAKTPAKAVAKTPPKAGKKIAKKTVTAAEKTSGGASKGARKPPTTTVSKALPKAASEPSPAATENKPTPEIVIESSPVAIKAPAIKAPIVPASAAAPALRKTEATEGELAPEFNLPRDGGGRVSLADYAGQKLVMFFYPRADTPGCTREAIDFTRLNADFMAAGTAVLGVSADPIRTQESFRNKHQLSVPLISDEAHEMLQAYGAWGEKSMYGRTFQGVLRTTVLIDADGRVARIWRGVKVDGHADAVLAAVRELDSVSRSGDQPR